jgi:3-hydroxyisobutyrate dehydrogenase/2-hydroxy-3-oxopropionate reductase
MAEALTAAGHEVVAWNRTSDAAETLVARLGRGRVAGTPREVASAADVCVSMLADGPAVRAVYGGPDGLLAGAHPGSVLCDASTVPPSTLQAFASQAEHVGAGLLDTPVSGSVALASSGTLTIMVGGEAEHLAIARPALEALASSVIHIGPLGAGSAMKLAVNTVIFGLNQSLAEALTLATAAGIAPATAYDVLARSAVGAPFVHYKRAAFLEPDRTPVAFALDLASKDLTLIAELADTVGVAMPGATADRAVIDAAAADIGGDKDFSAVTSQLLRRAPGQEGSPTTTAEAGQRHPVDEHHATHDIQEEEADD